MIKIDRYCKSLIRRRSYARWLLSENRCTNLALRFRYRLAKQIRLLWCIKLWNSFMGKSDENAERRSRRARLSDPHWTRTSELGFAGIGDPWSPGTRCHQ